jgi:hypothetical protein
MLEHWALLCREILVGCTKSVNGESLPGCDNHCPAAHLNLPGRVVADARGACTVADIDTVEGNHNRS